MAKEKKSFLLYCDLINTVEKLPDEQAGKLLKIILQYVNDKNPEVNDLLLQIAFEPIKNQLKRDLKKYEKVRVKRSDAGKAGASKRWQMIANAKTDMANDSNVKQVVAKIADNVNDNVNVTVTVNDNVINNNLLLEENFEILKSNQIWASNCQKSYGLSPDQFNKAIEAFKSKCIVACEDQSVSGLMRYFSNWFPINKERIFKTGKHEQREQNTSDLIALNTAANAILNGHSKG